MVIDPQLQTQPFAFRQCIHVFLLSGRPGYISLGALVLSVPICYCFIYYEEIFQYPLNIYPIHCASYGANTGKTSRCMRPKKFSPNRICPVTLRFEGADNIVLETIGGSPGDARRYWIYFVLLTSTLLKL